MRRDAPPFFLAGGEVVFLILGLRIVLWLYRGWRELRAELPPEPDGPGGLPALELVDGGARKAPMPTELRLAA